MTLFERTKNVSKERGLSLQKTAEKAGLSVNAIYRWKTTNPSPVAIKAVADVLNVSVDYLLGNTDEKNPHSNKNEDSKADLAEIIDDTPILSFNGRPISDRQREIIKQILELGDD
ncbi:possible transcriptional regulator Spx [Weissella oryzae SG25]|uniref:Possible transcriptional regulator Spx n=1 Tax=Weissella oryzae (strain DSM 25784 / JCM 18191 / LMG 30913 / SG25) TaxID=1329250 RepID=A0A069CWU7_WEIOS|nr:helix-turn-helix domain-containing protein [Weissella oryzae]GAK31832.1 possible transcriptional regulator Spx [Weissella oryzae SG25]